MAGILVYLPEYTGDDRGELNRRGLGSLLDPGVDVILTECRNGPNRRADAGAAFGKLVTFYGGLAAGNTPREVDLESQIWMEAPPDGELPKGRYWLGYVKHHKPSAGDLQRHKLIDGYPVLLEDGNAWVVPCCEYAPRRVAIDRETGDETRVVKSEHKEWVEWSNAIFSLIVSSGFEAITEKGYIINVPGGHRYASLTLAKNYRVNRDVVELLEILGDEQCLTDVILEATGVHQAARVINQKKSTGQLSRSTTPS